MHYWKKLPVRTINQRIAAALRNNINFEEHTSLGIPASHLDDQLFTSSTSSLAREPLLQVYHQNPNHIGCHTVGDSEAFFSGTQSLEKELLELLAVDLLKAGLHATDGYIAAGGTEANLQAVWIYRNYFQQHFKAASYEILLLSSEDAHYSIAKAANLLQLDYRTVAVDRDTRAIDKTDLEAVVTKAVVDGKKYVIAVANMGTTMFGSVDQPDVFADLFRSLHLPFFIHVDGAFGGFVYPVSQLANPCTFHNPNVTSITLDAHKMLQAPYGTGIFLVRKGLIGHVCTKEASYVHGFDYTISGSRSGANAVAVWMLLFAYGPYGWLEKINKLLYRTRWLCKRLDEMGVDYFNQKGMNIITIKAGFLSPALAIQYGLVPDRHIEQPGWYKIVIMDHVDLDALNNFLNDLKKTRMENAGNINS